VRLSIIVPTRACDHRVAQQIAQTRQRLPEAELILVEPEPEHDTQQTGGQALDPKLVGPDQIGLSVATTAQANPHPYASDRDIPAQKLGNLDQTPSAHPSAEDHSSQLPDGVRLTQGPRGRGTQCNAGARLATGDLLLFLHDDTQLPEDAAAVIETAFRDQRLQLACFRLAFDHPHPLLRLYARFSALDSYFTSFGDQGILIRRSFFERLGGFPNWPLFEDVELLRRARCQTRIKKLPAPVITSAVRFVEGGLIRQQVLNATLMVRFALGESPESLRSRYESGRNRNYSGADRA
jgi:hypothetical protein